jgi:predicted hydrocarbon binding protein
MKARRNENGKINLYLGREMGSNMIKVDEFDTLSELKKEGKRLLKEGAECANNFPAREYAYQTIDNNMSFGWL